MNPDVIFSAAGTVALLAWLLLAIRPRAGVVQLITGTIVPLAFAVLYVTIIAFYFGRGAGDFNSLAGVAALFRDPWMLLAGWVHYLAFDLLTGVWETRDAARRGIPHWMVVPCLFFTFMLGPTGWLLYQIVRKTRGAASPAAA